MVHHKLCKVRTRRKCKKHQLFVTFFQKPIDSAQQVQQSTTGTTWAVLQQRQRVPSPGLHSMRSIFVTNVLGSRAGYLLEYPHSVKHREKHETQRTCGNQRKMMKHDEQRWTMLKHDEQWWNQSLTGSYLKNLKETWQNLKLKSSLVQFCAKNYEILGPVCGLSLWRSWLLMIDVSICRKRNLKSLKHRKLAKLARILAWFKLKHPHVHHLPRWWNCIPKQFPVRRHQKRR